MTNDEAKENMGGNEVSMNTTTTTSCSSSAD